MRVDDVVAHLELDVLDLRDVEVFQDLLFGAARNVVLLGRVTTGGW
jgi:hypothetical protein